MSLIESLDQVVENEFSRMRAEVRGTIDESEYTIQAGERTTLHRMLSGQTVGSMDNWLRVAFVLGADRAGWFRRG